MRNSERETFKLTLTPRNETSNAQQCISQMRVNNPFYYIIINVSPPIFETQIFSTTHSKEGTRKNIYIEKIQS